MHGSVGKLRHLWDKEKQNLSIVLRLDRLQRLTYTFINHTNPVSKVVNS